MASPDAAGAADFHPFRAGSLALTDEHRATLRALSAAAAPDAAALGALAAQLAAGVAGAAPPAGTASAGAASAGAAASRLLQALLVDFARAGAPAAALRSCLEEQGLSSAAKAGAVADAYGAALPAMRAALAAQGLPLPRLADLSWRLDYLVSAKGAGRVGRPVYRVRMLLEEAGAAGAAGAARGGGATRALDFAASPQELEDLQARLHEALRAAAAVAGGGGGAGAAGSAR
jgi:hypothetical protein